jgi:transcriptional regulator with XRE-family HTH domain
VTEPTYNERIRRLRYARGWTQQQAAEAIADAISEATKRGRPSGVDAQWFGRLERGELRWPNATYRNALRTVFGVTSDSELGLSGVRSRDVRPTPQVARSTDLAAHEATRVTINAEEVAAEHDPDMGELDEMNRRELLRSLSVAGALIALPPDTGMTSDHPRKIDTAELDEYEQLNSHLWRVFALAKSKRAVYPVVRQQLEQLTATLQRSRTDATHKRACMLTSDLFQLAGEVFFDSNRYTDAAHCYTLAASASKEAGAYDLWACALTRHSFIGLYEHDFTGTASMLDAASRLAQHGDSELSTRYWVAAVQAEVFAGLGDLDGCNRALDTAEAVHALNGPVHTDGWLRFDGSRLAEQRGACYTRLQRYDLAETALTDALSQRLSARRRGSVLTDLTLLGIQRGDIDQVVTYGSAAVELAHHTGSGWIGRKLADVRSQLAPFNTDARIAELTDSITALTCSV